MKRLRRIQRIRNLQITLSQLKVLIVELLWEIITEIVKIIIKILMRMEESAMIQARKPARRKII